ncbi:MAG: SurA N-terminal domain-containing protein [Alphaproteobacteria bacterium]|nr:SurA N-terminal domain-containing protein [Alphaproteobacteria bacterium]
MLQNLRNASQSWLIRGFFAILIVCFVVLWGVGDMLRPGGRSNQVVATVGGHKISELELEKAFRRDLINLQIRSGKQIDADKARKLGLINSTLQRMITEKILDLEADHMGLAVTDAQVKQEIQSDPTFFEKDGSFDKERFVRMLEIMHINEKEYVSILRGEIRRNQLMQALIAGVQAPLTLVKALYEWQYQKRLVDIAIIKPADMPGILNPSIQDLKTYYDAHKSQFEAPEYRNLTALVISPKDIEKKVVLSDEEISAGFDRRRDEIKGGLPNRQENELILKELRKEKADNLMLEITNKIEDSLAEGATLDELAKKFDLKILKLQKIAKDSKLDKALSNETLQPEVIQAIYKEGFTNEVGTDPLLIDAGKGSYVLVRVDTITPKTVKPFEVVKADVSSAWRLEKQTEASKILAEQIQKEVNEGLPLVQAAAKRKIKVSVNTKLARTDDVKATEIPTDIKKQIFESEIRKAVFGRAQDGYLVVQNKEIIGIKIVPESKEFKDFSERVTTMLSNDIIDQYIYALEKKFRVEVNRRAFNTKEQ